MKVTKRINDNKITYRSIPDFEIGCGVKNSIALYGGNGDDYEETEITEEEWDSALLSGNVIGAE